MVNINSTEGWTKNEDWIFFYLNVCIYCEWWADQLTVYQVQYSAFFQFIGMCCQIKKYLKMC